MGQNTGVIDSDLFDEGVGYDDETGVRFASGLTPEERHQAAVLYRLFNELWGVCLVVGAPGTGKDLFGNYLTYKIKQYFPWKRILRDEKPRRLFGEYAGLFNENVLVEDLSRMRELAKVGKVTEHDTILEKAADDWVTNKGEVLLKNSVLYLTEYWRYCDMNHRTPMNKTMGAIHKMKRHLDCLVVGTAQLVSDLDKRTCLTWVDWKVTCTRSVINKTGFVYFVQKVKYDRRLDILTPLGRQPFPIPIDAGKPRSNLGDGKIVIRKADYKPETEEERIVLDVIRAGVDTYEGIVELIETDGDMSEWEMLETLKELKFRKSKRAVDFPCFFGLFNSKSVPQLSTRLRGFEG